MRQRLSQHATNVAYYWRNRQHEIRRVRVRQAVTVALLRDLRKGPCADCGTVSKPHQMDFDHRNPADKLFRLTEGRAMLMSRARWQEHARLLDQLRDVPCGDCARRLPPCAMDFDHRDPAMKRYGVTRMVGRAGAARILAEAAKCDIVCANCHRSRTLARRVPLSERE